MTWRFFTITSVMIMSFCCCFERSNAQNERWYVLKSIGPVSDAEVKLIIGQILGGAEFQSVWYNDSRSNTFGARSTSTVSWPDILHELSAHGYYLADVSEGHFHHEGSEAPTSIFYQEALYCSAHAENCPEDYFAKLNLSEWEALPADVRAFYLQSGNYVLSE